MGDPDAKDFEVLRKEFEELRRREPAPSPDAIFDEPVRRRFGTIISLLVRKVTREKRRKPPT